MTDVHWFDSLLVESVRKTLCTARVPEKTTAERSSTVSHGNTVKTISLDNIYSALLSQIVDALSKDDTAKMSKYRIIVLDINTALKFEI